MVFVVPQGQQNTYFYITPAREGGISYLNLMDEQLQHRNQFFKAHIF